MTKQDLIGEMVMLYNTRIKDSLTNSGVGDFAIKPSEKASKEVLTATHNWMKLFIIDYAEPFDRTFALCPKEQWNNYRILGLTDLPEIVLLRESKDKLIKAWKSRPTTIRRTYYAGE